MERFARYLLVLALVQTLGCASSQLAPFGSTIEIIPADLTVDYGTPNDRGFFTFTTVVKDKNGIPVANITINATLSVLRMLDKDGNYVEPFVLTEFTTDDQGIVEITVETPFGSDYLDGLRIDSGGGVTAIADIDGVTGS